MSSLRQVRHPCSDDEAATQQLILEEAHRRMASFPSPREAYDDLFTRTPIPDGMTLEEVDSEGMRGWWVRPPSAPSDRAILYLHGGGYALGSAKAYRGLAGQVASRAVISAFVLDYPLAPENPFPAAYEHASAAVDWLRSQGVEQVAVVGDSAGGGLALAVSNISRGGRAALASVVVFSPWADLALTGDSFMDPATVDPVLQAASCVRTAALYLAAADPRDPRASPLYASFEAVPPLFLQVGSNEILLDDARRYAERVSDIGFAVRLDIYDGFHHVFQRCAADLPSSRLALDDAAAFIADHWSGS